MESFLTILVICLISGLAFLLGSLLVIAKLPRTELEGRTVVKLANVTFATNSVLVGVTFLSAALAVVIPGYAMWLNSHIDGVPIWLHAELPPDGAYAISYAGDQLQTGGTYPFPLFKSEFPQGFAVTNKADHHSISAHYEWLDRKVHVSVDNVEVSSATPHDGYVDVPLRFGRALLPAQRTIDRTPGPQPSVPPDIATIQNPQGVAP